MCCCGRMRSSGSSYHPHPLPKFNSVNSYLKYLDEHPVGSYKYRPLPMNLQNTPNFVKVVTAHPDVFDKIPKRYQNKTVSAARDAAKKMKIKYNLEFKNGESYITIPQLEGRDLCDCIEDDCYNDWYLDIENFEYDSSFEPFDTDVFTTIKIQKQGGNAYLPRATSYYEQLTKEEADFLIKNIIASTLGEYDDIDDFELITDSTDFLD